MKNSDPERRETNKMNPKTDPAYCRENIQNTGPAVWLSGEAKWTTWAKETKLKLN